MARVSNTKIVHEDGGVQWVMERKVGHVTFMLNVYFSFTQYLVLRDMCAFWLRKARRELNLKTSPVVTWQTRMLMRGVMSPKEAAMRFTQ